MTDNVSTASVRGAGMVRMLEDEDSRRFVKDFVDISARKKRDFVDVWHEVLDNYLVSMPGMSSGWFNPNGYKLFGDSKPRRGGGAFLKDPETHQMVESLAAQGIGLILSPRDYLQAIPIGADDPEKARLVSRVLMAAIDEPGVFRTVYGILKDAFIFGTGIMEIGWQTGSRIQMVMEPVYDEMVGELIGYRTVPREVTHVDRPLINAVDIFDFYPDPSGTRIQQDMAGVAKRFRVTASQARQLAEGDGPYGKAAVERAISRARQREERKRGDAHDQRFSTTTGARSDEHAREVPDGELLLVGFEYWGEVPWKPSDRARNRVLTVLEDEPVRNSMNPYIDGAIPFKEFTLNPINGRFWGLGPAEVVRFLQDSADHLLMATNDAVDLAINVPLIVGAAFGGNIKQLKRRAPHDIIRAANPDAVKPVPSDFNAMQMAVNDLMRRKVGIREASGSLDPQSIGSGALGDRAPATQVAEVVRLASQRLELQMQLVEKDDFPWMGSTLLSRLRQFIPNAGAVATLAGEAFPFTLEDINYDADVRFVGSRYAMSKFQKFQQLSQAANILLTNPQGVQVFPELIARLFRDGLDMPDGEQVVARALERYQQMMEQQAAMQASAAGSPASNAEVATLGQPGENVARAGMALA